MIVKSKSATEKEELKISTAPVSHEDLFGTVLAGFEYKGKLFHIPFLASARRKIENDIIIIQPFIVMRKEKWN